MGGGALREAGRAFRRPRAHRACHWPLAAIPQLENDGLEKWADCKGRLKATEILKGLACWRARRMEVYILD